MQSIGYEYSSGIPLRIKDPGKLKTLNDVDMALLKCETDLHTHDCIPWERNTKHVNSHHKTHKPADLENTGAVSHMRGTSESSLDREDELLSLHTGQKRKQLYEEVDYETDFEDNLTYHAAGEDSLSVMVGEVSMPNGTRIKAWIVADTGSMTQLINKRYAREQGFKAIELPPSQRFSISSPGDGQDYITHGINLEVKIIMRRYLKVVENYCDDIFETELSAPEEKTIQMSFGVCENLPVPILWGGKQMRKYVQNQRTFSLRFGQHDRWQMPSISWLVACAEI
jgi:hypothetical protein